MKNSYYDGPVNESNRTLEEVEQDIDEEKKRCDNLTWKDIDGD